MVIADGEREIGMDWIGRVGITYPFPYIYMYVPFLPFLYI